MKLGLLISLNVSTIVNGFGVAHHGTKFLAQAVPGFLFVAAVAYIGFLALTSLMKRPAVTDPIKINIEP